MNNTEQAAVGLFRTAMSALAVGLLVAVVWRWDPRDWAWVVVLAVILVVLLGSWRGTYLSTVVRRRVALASRNRRSRGRSESVHGDATAAGERTTVLLRLGEGPGRAVPLATIAGYLNRFGIMCSGIRITTVDPEPVTWISLTVSATDNMAALLARDTQVPLHETAQVVRRRLADQLRELGWDVRLVDAHDIPWPVAVSESWRSIQVKHEHVQHGHLVTYRVKADAALADTLSEIWAAPVLARWTVLELTGEPARPRASVACALLWPDGPPRRLPVEGVVACNGDHRPMLDIVNPASRTALGQRAAVIGELPWWPTGDTLPGLREIPAGQPSASTSSSVSDATSR